jgi:hypothetical protein
MPLDIGVGVLLALGVAEYFGIPASPWLIAFGIAAALLPDIDVLTILLTKRWHHRTYTHYPLLWLPMCALAFVLLPLPYATLLTLGVYAHLIHDTFGIGWWGIAWLWPFSRRRFLFFPEKERRESVGVIASWVPEEEPPVSDAKASLGWIKHYYLRPNMLAYIEYGTLLIALAVLATYYL